MRKVRERFGEIGEDGDGEVEADVGEIERADGNDGGLSGGELDPRDGGADGEDDESGG